MKIYVLTDSNGQPKKYQSFKVKPNQGDFIRILYIPESNRLSRNRVNTFRHLSVDKAYRVYRIVNINQVIIKDDLGNLAHIIPEYFEVVEEISEREYKLLKDNNTLLATMNTMIRSKNRMDEI